MGGGTRRGPGCSPASAAAAQPACLSAGPVGLPCRDRAGPAQSGHPAVHAAGLVRKRPTDALWEVYRQQDWVFCHGMVVWGHVVQANKLLFSNGLIEGGASVIYSTDRWFDDKPDALASMASSLFAVKGKEHPDPEMAQFSRMLFNELDRAPRLPVPRTLSGGYPVFHTSIMVVRQCLPQGYLTHSLFPLMIEPQRTTAAIILPSRFWPSSLIEMWTPRNA